MNPSDPTQIFLHEAADLLTQIEEVTLALEQQPADPDAIHRLFRAFHTLKGSGAMFGFDAVAGFTHHVESALDEVRQGTRPVTGELLAALLAARDQIEVLLNEPDNAAANAACARIVRELGTANASAAAKQSGSSTTRDLPDAVAGPAARWRIEFQPPLSVAASGLDVLMLLDDMRRLGPCEVTADIGQIPAVEELDPEQCHLRWRIRLMTSRGYDAIKDVFIFVEDGSRLTIEPDAEAAPAAVGSPSPAAASATRSAGQGTGTAKLVKDGLVRVPAGKLDRLVSLVGEFVMNQSRLSQVALRSANADLAGPVEAIERLVDELRDSVLGIRMMPIGSTFSRFNRLVRDLSRDLGKNVDLQTEGAETELDKTVLDQLGDPLVHLIRNSLDHAIEAPEERQRLGKSPQGTVRLAATHAGSHVELTIQDDGRGFDTRAILAKAIEQKLVAADAVLTEKEIFNLVFLPGFSTAQQITSVSGRGVGMDVVKRQIEALRGTVQIASTMGVGTTVTLRLPLTLAIIDGLQVELAGDSFILPMSVVTENVELPRADRARQNGRNVVAVRGELVPYLRLRDLFELPGEGPAIEKIVIAQHEGQRVGIVVDRVLGSHQTVIQSLGRFYRHVEVCSGSTIMGDGRVALILDVPGLLHRSERQAALAARCAA